MRPSCSCSPESLCAECLDADYGNLSGVAMCRGQLWAERVARHGVDPRRPWPAYGGKSAAIARHLVDGLGRDARLSDRLAVACAAEAARWWSVRGGARARVA
jgi:hypothetical protein